MLKSGEQHLIERIRAGDHRLYAVLVDRYRNRAMTLAVRLVGDRQEAEELVQDAFVRAYRRLDQFRGESSFGTWFYRILYNLCMTRAARAKGRWEMVPLTEDEGASRALDPDDAGPAVQCERNELREALDAEIRRLPEHYKTVVTLFYIEDMSYEAIASVVDAPLGTVKTYLFRARALLRERMLERFAQEVSAP